MNERQINPITNYYHSHEKITNFIPFKWNKNERLVNWKGGESKSTDIKTIRMKITNAVETKSWMRSV